MSHATSIWNNWAYLNRGTYHLPDDLVTESDWVAYLENELGSYFRVHVTPELRGRLDSGKAVRADMVLGPVQPWGGRQGSSHAPFILEVKRNFYIGEVTKAFAQAADYARAHWDIGRLRMQAWTGLPEDGRMMAAILWLPDVADPIRRGASSFESGELHMLERIAGRMNVMILTHTTDDGWIINNSGNRQWSQRLGMANTKFNARVKEGSR